MENQIYKCILLIKNCEIRENEFFLYVSCRNFSSNVVYKTLSLDIEILFGQKGEILTQHCISNKTLEEVLGELLEVLERYTF